MAQASWFSLLKNAITITKNKCLNTLVNEFIIEETNQKDSHPVKK